MYKSNRWWCLEWYIRRRRARACTLRGYCIFAMDAVKQSTYGTFTFSYFFLMARCSSGPKVVPKMCDCARAIAKLQSRTVAHTHTHRMRSTQCHVRCYNARLYCGYFCWTAIYLSPRSCLRSAQIAVAQIQFLFVVVVVRCVWFIFNCNAKWNLNASCNIGSVSLVPASNVLHIVVVVADDSVLYIQLLWLPISIFIAHTVARHTTTIRYNVCFLRTRSHTPTMTFLITDTQ